jgi:hypothetical protein
VQVDGCSNVIQWSGYMYKFEQQMQAPRTRKTPGCSTRANLGLTFAYDTDSAMSSMNLVTMVRFAGIRCPIHKDRSEWRWHRDARQDVLETGGKAGCGVQTPHPLLNDGLAFGGKNNVLAVRQLVIGGLVPVRKAP